MFYSCLAFCFTPQSLGTSKLDAEDTYSVESIVNILTQPNIQSIKSLNWPWDHLGRQKIYIHIKYIYTYITYIYVYIHNSSPKTLLDYHSSEKSHTPEPNPDEYIYISSCIKDHVEIVFDFHKDFIVSKTQTLKFRINRNMIQVI